MTDERSEFIQELRNFATWLEANPEMPMPIGTNDFCVFATDLEQLKALTKKLGSVHKNATENYFWVEKRFGARTKYSINVERAVVCKKKIVGTRIVPEKVEEIVEWECADSILEGVNQ